jgi:hypothetical protein
MSSFQYCNNKTNINKERKYATDVFNIQGKQFNRHQQGMQNKSILNEPYIFKNNDIPSSEKNSKKQGYSFMKTLEGFQSIFNDNGIGISNKKLDDKQHSETLYTNYSNIQPSDQYITQYINESKSEVDKTKTLLNTTTNTITNSDAEQLQQQLGEQIKNYENTNNQFIGNTTSFVSSENNDNMRNKNVYVNKLYNEKDATYAFQGTYNNNVDDPIMTSLDGFYSFNQCKDTAYHLGKKYFGVIGQYFDNNNTIISKCLVADDNTYTKYGRYMDKCVKASDDKMYGQSNVNAIYSVTDDGNNYLGCYTDNPSSHTMTPTGIITNNNDIYQQAFFAGDYGTSPWGSNQDQPFPGANTSKWIWYTQDAQYDAPDNTNAPVLFIGQYVYDGSAFKTVEIYGMCDNLGTIKVNGKSIDNNGNEMKIEGGWGTNGSTGFIVTFNPSPAVNTIEVLAENYGGPAGFIMSFVDKDTGDLLTYTDTKWMFSTKITEYTPPYSQSFSVDKCGDYAKQYGFQYFGLQNILDTNTANNAQCFVSNDLASAEKYGESAGSINYDNNEYGINNNVTVYDMLNTNNTSSMGKLGYIDATNKVSEYPSSMIKPGSSYDILYNYNSQGNEIDTVLKQNKDDNDNKECQDACNSNDKCNGFVFDKANNMCSIKDNGVYSPSNISGNLNYDANYTLYMRNPELINNNNSCPTSINEITSLDWDSYTKSGNLMSIDTKCNLSAVNDKIIEERNKAQETLDEISNKVTNKVNDYIDLTKNMHNQANVDSKIVDKNLSMYKSINDKYKDAVNNGNDNINNILTNSQISVLQSNYMYIIWVILALFTLIIIIYVYRRMMISTPPPSSI